MRIGVVGSGSIAAEHVRAIRSSRATTMREVAFEIVVARREEEATAFAAEHGFRLGTTNLDTLLEDDAIEAVIVCSPSELHAAQTKQALLAGKHVLCEIPVAMSLAETDELIALSERVDRRLMVCQTQRYFAPLSEARRMIAAGELRPHAIVARYLFDRRDNVNWKGRQRSWIDNLLWHHSCHAVDAILWLLSAGEVDVAAQIAPPDPVTGIPMEIGIVMRTESGQLATVATSYHARLPKHDYLIIGEETSVEFVDGTLRGEKGVLVPAPESGDLLAEALPRQDAEFIAAIGEQREPCTSARSVRPAMAVLQAVQDRLDKERVAGP